MRRVFPVLFLLGCGERVDGVSVEVSAHVSALVPAAGISIREASVVMTSVTLVPCETAAAKLWRALSPVSTAWAHEGHVHASADLQPVTVSLVSEPHQYVGRLEPVAGSFCEAVVGLKTLRVLGARDGVPFELESRAERVVRFPVSLVLDGEHRTAELMLKVGPAELPLDPDAEQLLESVATSMRAP